MNKHSIKTQKAFVERILRDTGFITRNFCLENFITRLGAIINVLKDNGYGFKTEKIPSMSRWGKTYNYKYIVIIKPTEPIYK